ncbi:SPOSA6832_00663, partial [Sporobolomyces salmonicolor]
MPPESICSSLAPTDAEQEDPLSAVYAPRKVGTSEMDQFVDALSGSSRPAANGKTASTAPRRRGDSDGPKLSRLADGDKKARRRETSMSGKGWNSTAGYSSASGDDTNGTGHSRSQSASSDTSFASMTAGPTAAQLAAAQARGQPSPVDERDLYLAPGMERDDTHDTLKASERPWLRSVEAGGGIKSIEEIVAGYKGLGISTGGEGTMRRANVASPTLSVSPTPRLAIPDPPLAYVPFPTDSLSSDFSARPTKIKSIDEIIAEHAAPSYLAKRSAPPSVSAPSPAQAIADDARSRERESSHHSMSSVDSIGEEIRASAALQSRLERDSAPSPVPSTASRSLSHARSFSSRTPTSPTFAPISPLPPSFATYEPSSSLDGLDSQSIHSSSHSPSASTQTPTSLSPRIQSPKPSDPEPLAVERELATLLKSPRLTRLITLRRQPNTGLTVSLADVGSSTGNPVVVFLGLGSVRYLLALYDELAEVFNLRLICLDRWGLGRTSAVPDSQRGFVEWASIVDEVLTDHLALKRYSILAHSAGAPYAVASALRAASSPGKVQVHGSLHLLAPWVSTSADSLAGMYKYLKYVPSGVLKTAQAAEWKMQAWRLGKPPTLVHSPVGYDARAGKLISEAGPVNGRGGISRKASGNGGKSFLGGLFGGAGSGRDRTASMRSSTSDSGSDVASLRPSPSPSGGLSRRSSYFAASALSRSNPPLTSPLVDTSASTRTLASSGLPSPATPSPTRRQSLASFSTPRSPSPSHTPVLPRASSSLSLRPNSPAPPSASHHNSTLSASALTSGLLRASHAESLAGSTSDLLVLLERTSGKKGLGFEYKDVERPVKVWYGDKDDRISVGSVRWLEKEVAGRCEVEIVPGADHSLMANHKVMFDVLESIAHEWDLAK